jgi:hypothetical protein
MAAELKATVDAKAGTLTIVCPLNDLKNLPRSNSGKTLLVASTGGNKPTATTIAGKPLVVSVNAYIKPDATA